MTHSSFLPLGWAPTHTRTHIDASVMDTCTRTQAQAHMHTHANAHTRGRACVHTHILPHPPHVQRLWGLCCSLLSSPSGGQRASEASCLKGERLDAHTPSHAHLAPLMHPPTPHEAYDSHKLMVHPPALMHTQRLWGLCCSPLPSPSGGQGRSRASCGIWTSAATP